VQDEYTVPSEVTVEKWAWKYGILSSHLDRAYNNTPKLSKHVWISFASGAELDLSPKTLIPTRDTVVSPETLALRPNGKGPGVNQMLTEYLKVKPHPTGSKAQFGIICKSPQIACAESETHLMDWLAPQVVDFINDHPGLMDAMLGMTNSSG
jgi:hypothetical protein